jgi:hypothetical protein
MACLPDTSPGRARNLAMRAVNRIELSQLVVQQEIAMQDTKHRVPAHTSEDINAQIQRDTHMRVLYFERHTEEIPQRLRALDAEWDIERAIEANASALAFIGIVLGITRSRRWLVVPGLVTGFLFQHAIQGWCPPVPILRRLGFRTAYEIEEERQALKALRGDFAEIKNRSEKAKAALDAARA